VKVKRTTTCLGVVALLALGAFADADSFAEDKDRGGDREGPEALRRENRQLKAQLSALRAALAQLFELQRKQDGIFERVTKGEAASAQSPEPEADAPPAAKTEVAAAPARRGGGAPSLPNPKRRVATTGMVRGKVRVPPGEPVAYVYVENVFAPAVTNKVVIEQMRKQFVPSWAVIQRGTTVQFPNLDKVYHNVFSPSSGNTFDLGLYNSTASAKSHTFNTAGAADIFCNIHPQMAARILVVPNRLFAKVAPDGRFEIAGVPAGKRKLVAWAPGSKLNVQWLELGGGEAVDVVFGLEPKSGAHMNKNGQVYGSYQ